MAWLLLWTVVVTMATELVLTAIPEVAVGLQHSNLSGVLAIVLIIAAIWAVALLVPLVLNRRRCRQTLSPARIMARWLLWMVAVTISTMLVLTIITLVAQGALESKLILIRVLAIELRIAAIWAVVLYLVNLPFLLIAFGTKFYRERFCHALRLPVATVAGSSPETGSNPR